MSVLLASCADLTLAVAATCADVPKDLLTGPRSRLPRGPTAAGAGVV